MKLVPAEDFESVKAKYIEVIESTPGIEQHARWCYGKHPTDERLRAHISNGELCLLMDGEEIVGMVVIVPRQEQEYEAIAWAEPLANDQVAVLSLLAVCPAYQGRGLGREILDHAEELAASMGKKALRLDVLKSNLPAQHMYESAGFSYRGTQHLYAENTAWTDFLYYEKALD